MTIISEGGKRGSRGWRYYGQERPVFAVSPREGQESVWDYPRPPRVEQTSREVTVQAGTVEIARSRRCLRVLETASPPTFYLPPEDVRVEFLEQAQGRSRCEWKGEARYWTVKLPGLLLERVAWSYPDPLPGYEAIRDYLSFYPARVTCHVDSVRVEPQPGQFYGGWVTPEVVGPFKGEPGSEAW
jgi:uncharacterized protein (DUF427 family)